MDNAENSWKEIARLLEEKALYQSIKLPPLFINKPGDLYNLAFQFYCSKEKGFRTFKIMRGTADNDKIIKGEDFYNHQTDKYEFTRHYCGRCQHCNEYDVEFLLKFQPSKPLPKSKNSNNDDQSYLKLTKVGQYPAYSIRPDKEVDAFLSEEDKEHYIKAKLCYSQSYGIGAFAYLRRIVENEIVRIVKEISEIDRPESKDIKELLAQHEKTGTPVDNLIKSIYPHLPRSLKNIDDNPLKLLYSQLSGGLHQLPDDECMRRAKSIDNILVYVIKQINLEKNELSDVKKSINDLRKSDS